MNIYDGTHPSHKITYEWINSEDLSLDPRVQRLFDPRKVDKILQMGFDASGLGTLTVSRRDDGTIVILDGQHRREAGKQVGHTGKFHCEVHHGLTLKQEARIFRISNNQTVPTLVSQFLVRVTEGDPVALDIEAILASHGWQVTKGSSDGCITAVNAIERVYRTADGTLPNGTHGDLTDRVIGVITAAWGTDYRAANGQILMGVAQLFGRFGDAVNVSKLVKEMQAMAPVSLIGMAKAMQSVQGGRVPSAVAKVLVGKHNSKMRINLLPEWVWTR